MTPCAALALLLAVPAPAAVVEFVPLTLSPLFRGPVVLGPAQTVMPAAFSLVPLASPAALLTPAPAPLPLPAPLLALRTPLSAAARPVPDSREDAVALVRRLLAREKEPDQELAAVFDGTVLEGSPKVGSELPTRNGAYALADSRARDEGGVVSVYERWTGPGGAVLWVLRRRGPGVWEVREWRGAPMPAVFGTGGLPLPPSHYAEFSMSGGRLRSNIETAGDGKRPPSTMIDAKKSFAEALAWFGDEVAGVKGSWTFGSNLAEFNRLIAKGATPEEAALGTWTGRRAAAAGFTRVIFSERVLELLRRGEPGAYEAVAALFVKP